MPMGRVVPSRKAARAQEVCAASKTAPHALLRQLYRRSPRLPRVLQARDFRITLQIQLRSPLAFPPHQGTREACLPQREQGKARS